MISMQRFNKSLLQTNQNKTKMKNLILAFAFIISSSLISQLHAQLPNGCRSALNVDGLIDTSDFIIFGADFAVGTCGEGVIPGLPNGCRSDLNGDGVIDTLD